MRVLQRFCNTVSIASLDIFMSRHYRTSNFGHLDLRLLSLCHWDKLVANYQIISCQFSQNFAFWKFSSKNVVKTLSSNPKPTKTRESRSAVKFFFNLVKRTSKLAILQVSEVKLRRCALSAKKSLCKKMKLWNQVFWKITFFPLTFWTIAQAAGVPHTLASSLQAAQQLSF